MAHGGYMSPKFFLGSILLGAFEGTPVEVKRGILLSALSNTVNMSKGLVGLPGPFNSYFGDAAKGVVGKRASPGLRCERTLPPGVFVHHAVPFIRASRERSTASSHFLAGHGGNAAAALAFTRLLGVVLYPGLKDSSLQGPGRRTRCRCLSEMPTEGDYRPVEASTSPDGASSEGEANVESTSDQPFFQDVQIDLNLPRRKMLVEFTCNACNSRTQRVINPEAYRRGTVFVQCGGCEVYHQLVDNLNLIQEFDFRKEDGLTGV